jgi:DnaK suppressor protein
MNTKYFKQKLLEKERELLSDIARLEAEARAANERDVGDFADRATTDQVVSDTLDEASSLTRTLEDVRDALLRIEEGTYGKCIVCGRTIEADRLETVPWARYCLEDQKKQDELNPTRVGSTL